MKQIRLGMGLVTVGYGLYTSTTMTLILANPNNPDTWFMIFLTGCLILLSGLWIVTRKRPDAPYQHRRITARLVLRILSIAASFLLALEWLVAIGWMNISSAGWWGLSIIGDTAVFASGALAAWLFSDYAQWVHDDELSRKFDAIIALFIGLEFLDFMLGLFGSTVPLLFNIMALVSLGTYIWYFINIARLFDLIKRGVRDKRTYDANVLRDPEKVLR